jgi:hypothetical protein
MTKFSNGWLPIETAPVEQRVLLWGNGPVRFGIMDKLGNWRATHHGPVKGIPKCWMPEPLPPKILD